MPTGAAIYHSAAGTGKDVAAMSEAILRPLPIAKGLRRGWLRLGSWLRDEAVAERERWPLFAPVAIGIGAGLYFAFSSEPPLWPPLAAALAGAALVLWGHYAEPGGRTRIGPELVVLGLVLALVGGGMAAARIRTMTVAAPVLEKRIGPVAVTGRIAGIEDRANGRRITLDHVEIPGVEFPRTPYSVRINLRGPEPALSAGEWIRIRAGLGPPPAPAAPGAYDFQREAYFARLGAVGFAVGRAAAIEPPGDLGLSQTLVDRAEIRLEQLRYDITTRVRDGVGGEEGAVAAALMTGEQAAIPQDIIDAMRNSGLAHLLAVSGFNFVLIAGMLFYLARAFFALVPPLVLRFPTKKWAAGVAILGGAGYFAITGDSIATERAFIMVSLVFLAVIADRTPISMRTLGWAATLILLLQPESLLGASFQLSFAAVAALIAIYEGWGRGAFDATVHGSDAPAGKRWHRVATAYVAGIALTTVIASAATAPFLFYHFNRFATYGLVANLVAVPLTAVAIMPWSLLAFALMPFGFEKFALVPMGWGVAALDWIAKTASGWPGAVVTIPAVPSASIVFVALGGVWLCLWRRRWRYLGVPIVAAGLLVAALSRPPDIQVDEDAKLIAVRAADGGLMLSSQRAARMHAESWVRRTGNLLPEPWPKQGRSPDGRLNCDALGCLYRARGQVAALAQSEGALAEDCAAATVVVSLVPLRHTCTGVTTVIDRFDLWRNGAYAIWLDPDRVRVASARQWQGKRPWVAGAERMRETDD